METMEEAAKVVPFQLQFDKPIASQIKIGEWNPEKDLLAMVTEDSKLLLHRFNWQRLWTVSPGKSVTSLCWRPDGKAIVVGLEDGTITLHDVENGRQLRSTKLHDVSVVCLNWEEDLENSEDDSRNISTYEDRTSRFFPPPPRVPRMPGLVAGDCGFMDGNEDSSQELLNSACQRFSILCSGDIYGNICFSIFGIFPIAKINIHDLAVSSSPVGNTCRVRDASLHKVTLSKDLRRTVVLCAGELSQGRGKEGGKGLSEHKSHDFCCLVLDTSIFSKRKNELHQVAQQASSIEDLTDVIRTSISVMSKQWSEAMRNFRDKFDHLSTLISDHGFDSTAQEELLSLLEGARTSPPLHQFLVNSLGEAGVKRMSKVVCGAGKELQLVVLNHLQPAAEIIGFRLGELKGLSHWRARFQVIGLDEKLVDNATEKAGMLLVHIERFLGVLSSAVQQFSNFFNWLLKSVKILMSESSDQLLPFNSELVVIFLRFLYNQDPVMKLLESTDSVIKVDVETMQRIKELVLFGGFSDTEYLKRTLGKEFQQMESCFKEAFTMPFATVSRKITAKSLLPLFPIGSSVEAKSMIIPTSISYYKEDADCTSRKRTSQHGYTESISVRVPDDSFPTIPKCILITRRLLFHPNNAENDFSVEAALLCVPDGFHCVDLSLYKDQQIVLLLNETTNSCESSGNACMVIVQACDLPFVPLSQTNNGSSWNFLKLESSRFEIQLENEKVRSIPHAVVAPLAVSASRGVACVFAARKRALVYILEEDEEEAGESD